MRIYTDLKDVADAVAGMCIDAFSRGTKVISCSNTALIKKEMTKYILNSLKDVEEEPRDINEAALKHDGEITDIKDKLRRRNMQIKDLKECWKSAVKEIRNRDSIIKDMQRNLPEYR